MKLMKLAALFAAAAWMMAATAAEITPALENEIREFVLSDVRNLEREDLEAALRSYHSSKRSTMRVLLQNIFSQYDLRYQLIDAKIMSYTGEELVVRVTQETRKVAGTAKFRDNRVTADHTLIREDGKWVYKDSKIINIQFLN